MIDQFVAQARALRTLIAVAESDLRAGRLVAAERKLTEALELIDRALQLAKAAGARV